MYIFNKVTVNPQLPKSIEKLGEISENLWWSWNTEFLKIFKEIDIDLWEQCNKNPVKFLRLVDQEKLERASTDPEILRNYRVNVDNFESYMKSRTTWFSKQYPENKDDVIAYFSAEYGLDETLPIYSGGLGILSGDHLKSASDLGIPIVAIGLLYKNGYFNQKINKNGEQVSEYYNIEMDNLPIKPLKDENGEVIYAWVSTNEPFIIKDGLKPGKYTLSEMIAPEGYELSTETVTFVVKEDGTVDGEIIMYNKPETIEVPNTSSFKTITASLIGVIIIGLGSFMIYRNYKKNEEK